MEEILQIPIKPLSINGCWQGQRFKTKKYIIYEKTLLQILPNNLDIPKGKIELYYKRGFSSKLSDNDNPIKPFQDILQKKYKFNDSMIFRTVVEKEIVKKGKEYIQFCIIPFIV